MFSKKFDRRVYIALGVLALAGLLGASFGPLVLWPSHREAAYMPEQPIAFDHSMHAGEMKISCLYCHTEAEKGPHATIPPVSTCMNCHAEVQPKTPEGALRPDIQTLLDHWEKKEPILWNKVNDVADFVYFDHSRHVNSGVDCQDCHGDVKKMPHMRREFGLKMSWCLDCHTQGPPEGSNAETLGWDTRAPIHCSTCHR
jgi:menaquinone reductase, multiheme cytochrome c subunit